MKSCTIIVSHFNSLPFLRACIRQLRKYKNPEVEQNIIISDQSDDENFTKVVGEFGNEIDSDIEIIHTKGLYSGYGVDWIMRNVDIKTDYICQLHVDAFPINKNWLNASIGIMQEADLKFIGVLQFICDNPNQNVYYYKNSFFAMAQSFHIGRADVYKEMALEGGFTRYHNRPEAEGMTWNNKDWDNWAQEDYGARGSDDDVVAFCWQDNHREDNKMGLGITGIMGVSSEGESGYGSIIEDMVFHFGFCRESLGVMEEMGAKYREWTRRINEGFTDELIEEMLTIARTRTSNPENSRVLWVGKLKKTFPPNEELNKIIQELKQS